MAGSGGSDPTDMTGAGGNADSGGSVNNGGSSNGGSANNGGANNGGSANAGGKGGAGGSAGAGVSGGAGMGVAGAAGSTVDAGRDVAVDSGLDARPDTGSPIGRVRCGVEQCELPGEFCCIRPTTEACVSVLTPALCGNMRDQLHCDSQSDCPSGQICCVDIEGNAARSECVAAFQCNGKRQELCSPNDPTPCSNANNNCSMFNGGAFVPGYNRCH
ncbi:MAG TPA: hypothetical protein VJT73_18705 [Polyangiaceae bacterium]|nr:hypothetical protein [Polyangiaceae bacterium]